jgi:hypothetical protein
MSPALSTFCAPSRASTRREKATPLRCPRISAASRRPVWDSTWEAPRRASAPRCRRRNWQLSLTSPKPRLAGASRSALWARSRVTPRGMKAFLAVAAAAGVELQIYSLDVASHPRPGGAGSVLPRGAGGLSAAGRFVQPFVRRLHGRDRFDRGPGGRLSAPHRRQYQYARYAVLK